MTRVPRLNDANPPPQTLDSAMSETRIQGYPRHPRGHRRRTNTFLFFCWQPSRPTYTFGSTKSSLQLIETFSVLLASISHQHPSCHLQLLLPPLATRRVVSCSPIRVVWVSTLSLPPSILSFLKLTYDHPVVTLISAAQTPHASSHGSSNKATKSSLLWRMSVKKKTLKRPGKRHSNVVRASSFWRI